MREQPSGLSKLRLCQLRNAQSSTDNVQEDETNYRSEKQQANPALWRPASNGTSWTKTGMYVTKRNAKVMLGEDLTETVAKRSFTFSKPYYKCTRGTDFRPENDPRVGEQITKWLQLRDSIQIDCESSRASKRWK